MAMTILLMGLLCIALLCALAFEHARRKDAESVAEAASLRLQYAVQRADEALAMLDQFEGECA